MSTNFNINCTPEEPIDIVTDEYISSSKFCSVNTVESWPRLSTGCPSIDSITRGGVPISRIVEIVGPSGVGKTQLCLQLSLMVQLPATLGGLDKGAVYICTEDVFPSKRLHQLASSFQRKYCNNYNNFEDNIYIQHVTDFVHLERCLFANLPKLLTIKDIGLIVIDSIAGIFRSENDDVNYTTRSHNLVELVRKLNKLSDKHHLALIAVNQVTDNLKTNKTEPCLGLTWSNLVTCRFSVNRPSASQLRSFETIFAPDLRQTTCQFNITEDGCF